MHTYLSGFSVKRAGINPGAPGFVYPFYPHRSMRRNSQPPHLLGKLFFTLYTIFYVVHAHKRTQTYFFILFLGTLCNEMKNRYFFFQGM